MENILKIIGNEHSVIGYNLNKQFSNIRKIIVTKEIILSSYEDDSIKNLFSKIHLSNSENYLEIINEAKSSKLFSKNIRNELYSEIQENLVNLSESFVDVKLKDFNFMSSVSNSRLTVSLRCDNYSINKFFVEKGEILTAIKQLIKEYLEFSGNVFRISRIENFQIEIFESEEIYKKVSLKKEEESIILSSSFGFEFQTPIEYSSGNEFYCSIEDKFKLFNNKQNSALVREHNKIVEKEISNRDKILSNDELVLINEVTKNISDANIELYFNHKGNLKILNVSLLENQIFNFTENGFYIHKSTKNYDKISIITIRDDLDEDYPNPKYLLIKNSTEIRELIENVSKINKVDGIIFTQNFYSKLFERIGHEKDIDIIYYDHKLQKSLNVDINKDKLFIENENNNKNSNPFSNILTSQNKEKDEILERLKNIDLSTPKKEENTDNKVQNIAEELISSSNSSINSNNTQKQPESGFNGGKRAIDFLIQSAFSQKDKIENRSIQKEPEQKKKEEFRNSNPFDSLESFENKEENKKEEQNQSGIDLLNKPIESTVLEENVEITKNITTIENINISKYENIIATNILTTPNIVSGQYFVDSNTLELVQDNGNVYYITTNPQEQSNNTNIKYILPIELKEDNSREDYLLINSLNDYFLIENFENKYFINLSRLENSIKKNVLKDVFSKFEICSLIILKENIYLIKEYIHKIENLMIKDLTTIEEFDEIKRKILSFEKDYIIKKLN